MACPLETVGNGSRNSSRLWLRSRQSIRLRNGTRVTNTGVPPSLWIAVNDYRGVRHIRHINHRTRISFPAQVAAGVESPAVRSRPNDLQSPTASADPPMPLPALARCAARRRPPWDSWLPRGEAPAPVHLEYASLAPSCAVSPREIQNDVRIPSGSSANGYGEPARRFRCCGNPRPMAQETRPVAQ